MLLKISHNSQENTKKSSTTKNGIRKKFKVAKEIWSNALYLPLFCPEPEEEYLSYISDTSTLGVFRKHGIVSSTMKSQLNLAKFVPTWTANNSLLTDNLQATTKLSSLPVTNGSLTDWSKYQDFLHSPKENYCFIRCSYMPNT